MDEDSICTAISGLDDKHLLEFLRSNSTVRLKTEDMRRILESPSPFYAQTVFFLSETNRVIAWETYRRTFIFENYDNFGEEEMYYLCEAVKNQIAQGFDDFYLVMHHFFRNLGCSQPLQALFMFLLEGFGFEIREFVLTHGILESIVDGGTISPVFRLKVIRRVLETSHPVVSEYLANKKFKMVINSPTGCTEYFKKWYKDSSLIEVRFV